MDRLASARGVTRSELLRQLALEEEQRQEGLPVVSTREEVLALLTREARAGSVRAMALLRDEFTREELPAQEPHDPFAELDQLAPRREARKH
jgi:hypothetical protein